MLRRTFRVLPRQIVILVRRSPVPKIVCRDRTEIVRVTVSDLNAVAGRLGTES
jgi:hypothetical protein